MSRKLDVVQETDESSETRYLTRSPMIDIVRGVEDGGDMFFPLDLGSDASPKLKAKKSHQFGSVTAPALPPSNVSVVSDCSPMSSPSTDSSMCGADPRMLELSKSCDVGRTTLRIPITNSSQNMNNRRSQSLASKKELEVIFRSLEEKKRSALTRSRKSPRVNSGVPMPFKRTAPLGRDICESSSLVSVGQQYSDGSVKMGSVGDDRDWFSD